MTTHRFEPATYHNTFGPHEPVLRIDDGDTVETTTIDAHGYDRHGEQVADSPNPQTGPFYVMGAEPGDAVAIRIEHAYPNRATGWTYTPVALHVVDAGFVHALPAERERLTWALDLAAGTARVEDPVPEHARGLARLVLPLAPMLGCIGVAPAHGQAIWTATSGPHGGNMDYRGLVTGTTVVFPVSVPGALIHLGDGHAVQGDGEIVGTGIETSFDVRFSARILKGKQVGWPRGEDADFIFTLGNARPLDQALQHATTEMLRWLQDDYGLSVTAASTLLGQVVRYEVGNVYDPAYTVVCKVAKGMLPREHD
ncbi:MAG: acetamidase/formamidase family protein [Anaerolineae bacterium]|nr:acetamidase/formamidase family protein [Anaerolineae bacterium]